jgi:hypothetical protein
MEETRNAHVILVAIAQPPREEDCMEVVGLRKILNKYILRMVITFNCLRIIPDYGTL